MGCVGGGMGVDGAPQPMGGRMPAAASIQDAEMRAIYEAMRAADARGRAHGRAPRLLILSDCLSVLAAIDRAWSDGSAWRLAKQHRQAMLESILLLMREFHEHGGVAIFLWTPSHHGVLPNNYADMVAKAHLILRPEPEEPPLRRLTTGLRATTAVAREGSLVQYGLRGDGPVQWAAADRRLLELAQRRLGCYVMRELSTGRRTSRLILYAPQVVPGLWPWTTRWRAVLLSTSTGGGSGGHRGHATALGCVMRVRSGQLGHPSDFDAAGEGDSMLALADVWQRGGDDAWCRAAPPAAQRPALHHGGSGVGS